MSNNEIEDPGKMRIVQKWRRTNFDRRLDFVLLNGSYSVSFPISRCLRAFFSILRPMSMETLETFYWKSRLVINQPCPFGSCWASRGCWVNVLDLSFGWTTLQIRAPRVESEESKIALDSCWFFPGWILDETKTSLFWKLWSSFQVYSKNYFCCCMSYCPFWMSAEFSLFDADAKIKKKKDVVQSPNLDDSRGLHHNYCSKHLS